MFAIMTKFFGIMKSKLPSYIVQLRDEKGWNTKELARRARMEGETLRKIETGETKEPGIGKIIKIANALKISEMKLISAFKGDDPDSVEQTGSQSHQILLAMLKQIPGKFVFESMGDDEIFDALLASKGEEKMRQLMQEMLRRKNKGNKD